MQSAVLAIVNPSLCPSFRLSVCPPVRHIAGTESKRLKLRSWGLHWRIAHDSSFLTRNFTAKFQREQAGRRQVRSMLNVCDIDEFVFSSVGHTPLLILIHACMLTFANVTTTQLSITLNINHAAQLCAFAIYCYCTS